MRIFKNAWFKRFAKREKLSDRQLLDAIDRAAQGIVDAQLGGSVIKQRVARSGQGKSGGYRTIIIFRQNEKAFFVYGFAKNQRDNISKDELKAFRLAAKKLLKLSDEQIELLVQRSALTEVMP